MPTATKSFGGPDALFEITVSFNPQAIRTYFHSDDGFWRRLWTVVMTLLWLILACCFQLSLNTSFPELPLYPLPVTIAYLTLHRTPTAALVCSLLAGLIVDAQTFSHLGLSSAILASIVLLTLFFRSSLGSLENHFGQYCLIIGLSSTFLYVFLKLTVYTFIAADSNLLPLAALHLIGGSLLSGLCLTPILYSLLDVNEWLFRIRRKRPSGTP